MIELSVCIPTYNFGRFIGETLAALEKQLDANTEIVVYDGGSTDDTAEVLGHFSRRHPNIRYHRAEARGGIDNDIEALLRLARGSYCWLVSADDIPVPDALALIRKELQGERDIYLLEHTACDIDMRLLGLYPLFSDLQGPADFDFSCAPQRLAYFASARTTEPFFSFLSTAVFKRVLWDERKVAESIRGTCWIVAGHLLGALRDGCSARHTGHCAIHKRGDNDSFMDQGIVNRYRIAIEGFRHVGETVFGADSAEAAHIRRVLRAELRMRHLLQARLQALRNPQRESLALLERLVRMHFDDGTTAGSLRTFAALHTPRSVLELMSLARGPRRLWRRLTIALNRIRHPGGRAAP